MTLTSFSLVSEVHMLSRLAILLQRLQHCSAAPSIVGGDNLSTYFLEAERSSRRIQDALREVEEGIWRFRELQNATPSSGDLAAVHAFGLQISSLVKALSSVTQTAQISGCSIFTFGKHDTAPLEINANEESR
jgi:hypothetical protein